MALGKGTQMRVSPSPKKVAGHGVRPTKFASAAAAVLAATLSAGVLLVNGPHSGNASAASPTWQSGVYVGGCNTTAINSFKTWRGGAVERGMVFLGSSWSAIQNPTSAATCLKGLGIPVTFSVPMLPSSGASIATGATGSYDSHWTTLAKNLVSAGEANADLRIGWEMNGNWFNWSAQSNPTAWKNYWIHIVKAMKAVSGQHFTFDWSPGGGQTFAVENAYPGDAYVDYIGLSLYDQYYGSKGASAATKWNVLKTGSHGLDWQASFAAAHGKKLAYPEWALATTSSFTGHGNGDNAYFIQQFYAFLKGHNVAYEIYFDTNHSPNTHMLNSGTSTSSNFKLAGAAYRSLFGGIETTPQSSTASSSAKPSSTPTKTSTPTPKPTKTSTPTPKPTKTPTPTPTPTTSSSSAKDTLLYSTSAARTSSHLVNGATLTGSAAVWITPSGNASSVTFTLDGKSVRIEKDSPFDLAGTAVSGAKLYNFAALAKGKHTITAVIALRTGGSKTVTATITR
jgi:hypothetical protein